jgi:hypothetical protein
MSTQDQQPPISLTHADHLALIANQGRIVSEISEAVMRGHPKLNSDNIVSATNRLTDLVSHWIGRLSAEAANDKAA